MLLEQLQLLQHIGFGEVSHAIIWILVPNDWGLFKIAKIVSMFNLSSEYFSTPLHSLHLNLYFTSDTFSHAWNTRENRSNRTAGTPSPNQLSEINAKTLAVAHSSTENPIYICITTQELKFIREFASRILHKDDVVRGNKSKNGTENVIVLFLILAS